MKILLLTTHLNLGGIGVYVVSLAKGLAQRGHRVFVASGGGDLAPLLQAYGATHLAINIRTKSEISPKVFFACRQITKIIRENGIELLHAHTRVTQVLAYLCAKRTAVPYLTTCHGFFKARISRRLLPCWGNCSIAISEAVREHLVNDLGMIKERIVVVHNGVEIERFYPNKFTPQQKDGFKNDYGLKSDGPIIGTVARLSSVKGQCYLILAMKKILELNPRAQLLLVGDGPEKNRLMHQTRQLNIEDKVFFAPPTLDTSIPLSVMDVFVLPSLLEGLGLAIIEAQAMGLAVIASDVGGIYTLIKDGINGFLVRPKDTQGLAETILKLLKDKNLAQELGRRAAEQAQRQFNLWQMIEGIERAYTKCLTLNGSRE